MLGCSSPRARVTCAEVETSDPTALIGLLAWVCGTLPSGRFGFTAGLTQCGHYLPVILLESRPDELPAFSSAPRSPP